VRVSATLEKASKMTKVPTIPETGFLRLQQVLTFIPVSKTTWWNGVKSGRFPSSIKLGPGITAWRAEDIRMFIENNADATTPLNWQ
jgi:Predicted transcriptional regulator